VGILFDVRLLSVGLGSFFTVALAVAAHRAWRNGGFTAWLGSGLLLGLGALARGNLLLVAPWLLIVAFLRGRTKTALGFALGVGLALAPAIWHNHAASGEFLPVSLGGGVNLYRGNNAHFETAAVYPFRLPPQRDGLVVKSRLIASIEADKDLSLVEADRVWLVRALLHWADNPTRAVGLTIRKLTQALGPIEIGDHMNIDHTVQSHPVLRRIPPMMLPIGVFGLLGLLVTRRSEDAGPAAVILGGLLSVALFFVVSRYRVPLVPLLAIYAGGGLRWLWNHAHSRSRLPFLGGLACVAVFAVSLMAPTTHAALPWNLLAGAAVPPADCAVDQHIRRDPDLESRFEIGVFALNHGRFSDAEEVMWRVFREDPGHTAAGVNLSWLLLKKGAIKESAEIASRVVAADQCDDKAWSNLATARLRMGQFTEAQIAATKATQIDPYNPGYWSTLGEAELALGRRSVAQRLFERTLRWAPDIWQARARLGRMALEAGKFEDASRHLQVAVSAQPRRPELIGMLGLSEVGRGNREGARKLLSASVKAGIKGPAITALARALSEPSPRGQ
jgi:Flp pilus assembly protein TadD